MAPWKAHRGMAPLRRWIDQNLIWASRNMTMKTAAGMPRSAAYCR